MSGPSTIEHHQALHDRIRALEAIVVKEAREAAEKAEAALAAIRKAYGTCDRRRESDENGDIFRYCDSHSDEILCDVLERAERGP
jgi:hypothetical protein